MCACIGIKSHKKTKIEKQKNRKKQKKKTDAEKESMRRIKAATE